MLLGKRPRPPVMRRTRSMSGGMAVDTPQATDMESHHEEEKELVISHNNNNSLHHQEHHDHPQNQTILSNPASHPVIQTPHFLRTCGLCNCRLAPGRDIYMYRGDTAFCSLECREQQIKQDQRKEKWKVVASIKEDHHHHHHRRSQPAAAAAKASTKTQTAAACPT